MGKTPKLKKKTSSARTRSARRALSPTPDRDSVPRAPKQTPYIQAAPPLPGGGIRKAVHKSKLSRAQKERQRKTIERALIVEGRKEVKVLKSFGKAKVIKERAKLWTEVNEKVEKELEDDIAKAGSVFDVLAKQPTDNDENGEWEDVVDKEGDVAMDGEKVVDLPVRTTSTAKQSDSTNDTTDIHDDDI